MKPVLSSAFIAADGPAARTGTGRAGGASLDVLRFVAAAFILLFHYGQSSPVALARLSSVFGDGWLATDFFLLLSGYILSRAYGERLMTSKMRRTHFFLRRFARLWPSHMAVLLVFGGFVLAASAAGFSPGHMNRYGGLDFFAQAFLVHGWGMFSAPSWNVPTWTLSALLVCYGLFSVYLPLIYNRSLAVIAAMAAGVLLLAHAAALGLAHHAFVDLPFEWGLLRAVPLFILGNLVERASRHLRVARNTYWLSLAVSVLAIALLTQVPRNTITDTFTVAGLATVLAISGAVTFSETPITRRMGRASFALFLTHSLVGAVLFNVLPKVTSHFGLGLAAQWAMWAAGVGVALAAAFAFDALVDRPLSERVSRLSFVEGGA